MANPIFKASRAKPRMDSSRNYIDLRSLNWEKQAVEDDGEFSISGFGAGIDLQGDSWIFADLSEYEITNDTIIQFELYCTNRPAPSDYYNDPDRPDTNHFSEPDIVAIGVSPTKDLTRAGDPEDDPLMFQVYGTLEWEKAVSTGLYGGGNRDEGRTNSYRVQGKDFGARWVKYEVVLGAGNNVSAYSDAMYLYLIAQHKNRKRASVQFRNIRIFTNDDLIDLGGLSGYFIEPYHDYDQAFFELNYNGRGVLIGNNCWYATLLLKDREIDENTYLEGWVKAGVLGESHAIAALPADFETGLTTSDETGMPVWVIDEQSLDPYIFRFACDEGGEAPNVPFPFEYTEWVKFRIYFTESELLNKTCRYLAIICPTEFALGDEIEGTFEVMNLRFGKNDPDLLPEIGSEKTFLSHRNLQVNQSMYLRAWRSSAIDKYVMSSRGSRDTRPRVKYFTGEEFSLGQKRIPSVTGQGSWIESGRDETIFDYLDEYYYCHWLVVTVPFIPEGERQTIFEIKGTLRDSLTGRYVEYIRIGLVGGGEEAGYLPSLLYTHESELTERFTVSNPLPYTGGLLLFTCYKEDGVILSSQFNPIRKTIYRFMFNNTYLENSVDMQPEDAVGEEFESNDFIISAFGGGVTGSNPFFGDIYLIATSLRRSDLCNVRAINKEIMDFYRIVP